MIHVRANSNSIARTWQKKIDVLFNKIRQLFCTFLHFWINICTFQLTAKHGMSLMWEVIVCFDDIGGIVDHQCLHILFITCIYCIYQLPFECVFFKDNSSKMCIESCFFFFTESNIVVLFTNTWLTVAMIFLLTHLNKNCSDICCLCKFNYKVLQLSN